MKSIRIIAKILAYPIYISYLIIQLLFGESTKISRYLNYLIKLLVYLVVYPLVLLYFVVMRVCLRLKKRKQYKVSTRQQIEEDITFEKSELSTCMKLGVSCLIFFVLCSIGFSIMIFAKTKDYNNKEIEQKDIFTDYKQISNKSSVGFISELVFDDKGNIIGVSMTEVR